MKVICDNCRAVYKIPDEKLVKPVNKATCRQCGHRMLIPRPRMDADPDERTLVTAVPPTPAPAPPRAEFNDDPPTNPMGRNPSNPSVRDSRDVELHTATPAPVQSASGTKPRGRRQPTETTQPPISAVSNAHDPATDMSIAFMGVLIALMGAFALAVVPLIQGMLPGWLAPIATSLGLMVASGGSLLALFVMVTGARGRQPAKPLISFMLAAVFAFIIGLIPMGTMGISSAFSVPKATVASPAAATPVPVEATASNTTDTTTADTTPATPPETPKSEAARPKTPAATSSSSRSRRGSDDADRSSSRSSSSRRSATPEPDPTPSAGRSSAPPRDELELDDEEELDLPDDILADEPEPKPVTASSGTSTASSSGNGSSSAVPTKPPIGAIDMMVKSNVSVKKCFFKHQSAKGALPPRIDVRFTIKPDGTATKVGIKQVEYAATDLDFCLGSAIKGIRFPPSKEGVSLTFPFQFS